MISPQSKKRFVSFDGSEAVETTYFSPDRYRVLEGIFNKSGNFSAQGACLSYAPLSFGSVSSAIQMTQFDRILAFDSVEGTIEVESGVTLGKLAVFSIPKGWYLKVQPGHPSITVGGCLGADVHGKNQFIDLNFKEQVRFIRIYHPSYGTIYCDRATHENVFHLTCGGLGLTGVVLSVGIQLGRLRSHRIISDTIPVDDIEYLPSLLKERSASEDLLYSWHDFNSRSNFGQGFLKIGRYQPKDDLIASDFDFELAAIKTCKPLNSEKRGPLPLNLLNRFSVSIMNKAYSAMEFRQRNTTLPLTDFLFPVLNKTIYFDLFGKSGFHETQVVIPYEIFVPVVRELQSAIRNASVPITLASCKSFKGRNELLRFIGDGIVLAFNLPRTPEASKLLARWDEIVKEANCLPSISKDSRLPYSVVQACYPEYEKFRTALRAWDPARLFKTATSERLKL